MPGSKVLYHLNSGFEYGSLPNILHEMDSNEYADKRTHNVFWPFAHQEEWELAKLLTETLNQSQINQFLKLSWTKKPTKPTFTSAYTLTSFMEVLPSGPEWKMQEIYAGNYKTAKPMILLYCDGLEVVKALFGNPIFTKHMMYNPRCEWNTQGLREYGEWMPGDYAWAIQDQLPKGSTIIGVIGASDKTTVT
ncbi:hypothetical protein SERLA73DRAFT_153550 [Serpula lacrymans var. lacrymans S7.3]|uniref:Uncharacterized protein n=1 Tax=Serpula lacrymans var. lacrymans (strain S7.3) TaxID=936435 RepID=F8Q045_SERL3|nr:hypothetical protein SERLA73DRAFT_153550 [Serpula lacrymans var. lacrymans S7.3]